MERTDNDVINLIDSLPEEFREDTRQLHEALSEVMTGLSVSVWEGKFWGGSDQRIIGYGDYSYQRPGKQPVEWFMVGLAVQKNYISIYVNATEDGKYLAEKYADRLGKAKVGKASISFRKLADVNLEALLELVKTARIQMA